ncbi:MAG TPA: hypothetical protein DEG17_09285 [Cyanobacteria bacterium UBA11149]|nr:hypothetical protein [Cyanobacteria bacterium UBA11367]HBE57497.1 hypothetical protein [Cyanobacteria bacterium UBA11366]HBK66400.1 hypothetical protein [Cyanobacteria bacterium UBA11166]HBR73591.1 hypothetical protein [Cyanobacteria bacterium UBA11159]HBS68108.1 hypothetical protein [Cyanobacteria bacterium UBA11153]HBW89043.1 hypothetical protein [Cyanobacteria bacterium UBA11149]HCA96721.1 hypothetical protein [Cyanobacteria bacterium UBA9226]
MSSDPNSTYSYSTDNWNQESNDPSQDHAPYSESYDNNDEQYGYGTVDPYLEPNHPGDEGNEFLNSYGYENNSNYGSDYGNSYGTNSSGYGDPDYYNSSSESSSFDGDENSHHSTNSSGVVINYYDNHIEYNDMHEPHIGNICCGGVNGDPGTIQT